MKKLIAVFLALMTLVCAASLTSFAADGEELKSPNPVPGRANPTGNILEFDDLTGAAPKGASGYSVNTQEEVKTDDGWTLAFDAMVEAPRFGNSPDGLLLLEKARCFRDLLRRMADVPHLRIRRIRTYGNGAV